MNYSVLMSVYYKEKPDYLRQSMESMFNQSVPTDDFVLVCDGPLNKELDVVIEEMQEQYPDILRVLRLEKNVGLGNALNKGIKLCKNDIVARMDSDDISRPDRCERQLAVLAEHPEVSLTSGIVEEFSNSPNEIAACRIVPEKHEDILQFMKKRNPFNHPCMMYRKKVVEAAGGYQHFYLLEDYYLWIRILSAGFRGYNLQEPILWMRAGKDMYNRRAGYRYLQAQIELFSFMRRDGIVTLNEWAVSVFVRCVFAIIPNCVRKFMFKKLLRA